MLKILYKKSAIKSLINTNSNISHQIIPRPNDPSYAIQINLHMYIYNLGLFFGTVWKMDNNKTQSSSSFHFNCIALLLYINLWLFLFLLQNCTRHICCYFSKTLQRTQLSLLCHKRATSEQYNSPAGKPSRASGGSLLTSTEQTPSTWSVSVGSHKRCFQIGFERVWHAQRWVMCFWNLQITSLIEQEHTLYLKKQNKKTYQ